MTDLVLVEWYTYERIPRSRHAIVTMRREALKWLRGGARITLHELLPEVAKEIVWMGPSFHDIWVPCKRGTLMAVDLSEDFEGADIDPYNLNPATGVNPVREIMTVPYAAKQVSPDASSLITAPMSLTAAPPGVQTVSAAPQPGQPVNLAAPNPVNVSRLPDNPVIPQGSEAPMVQVAQNTALPGAQKVPTGDPNAPAPKPEPLGTGMYGSNRPPNVVANPNANPVEQEIENLNKDLVRQQRIANDPSTNFWWRSQADAARDKVKQIQGELAGKQKEIQTQQTNLQLADNLGLTKKMPSTADAAALIEEALSEAKQGNFAAYRGLQGAGQGARADLYKPEMMQALDKNVTAASNLYQKLDTATNENEYKRLREDVLKKAGSDSNAKQFGLTEGNIPQTKQQYDAKRSLIQAPMNDASKAVATYQRQLDNQGIPQPVANKEAADAITKGFVTSNGDPVGNIDAVTLNDMGGLQGARAQPGSRDLAKFGPSEKGGTWNDMNKERRDEITKSLATEEMKGAIGQYKMSKAFSEAAGNDKLYQSAAGVAFIEDALGAIGRDVAEGSKAAGSIGLVKILDSKFGGIGNFLNKSETEWSEYKSWVEGGKQGPEKRLSQQTIDGIKEIAKFKAAETTKELGRLEGPIATLGRYGGSLKEVGLDKETQELLSDIHDKSLMQGRLSKDAYDAVIRGDRRIFLPQGTKGEGVIPAGSYAKSLPPSTGPGAPTAAAPPAARAPVTPGSPPAGGSPAAPPPAGGPGKGGYEPVSFRQGLDAGESGGRNLPPNASGASGYHQFLKSTWAENKPAGAPDEAYKATKEQQDQALETFTAKNTAALKGAGIPVNNLTLSIAHNLGAGAGGAKTLLSAPDSDIALNHVNRAAAAANPQFFWDKGSGRQLTVAESKAKYAQFYRADGDTGPAQPAAQSPGFLSRVNQLLTSGVQGSGPQGRATPQEASQAAIKPVAAMAPAVGGTLGAIGGTMAGGPVGTVAGGATGTAAGENLKEYLTKPEGERDYLSATGRGLAEGTVASIPGAGMVPMAARIVGGGLVGGGSEALKDGTAGEIANATIGGVLGAVGGEAFGQALGMVGHQIYNRFSGAAKAEVQAAAQVLAEQKPRNVDAMGKSVENTAYTKAKETVEAAGLDAEHAAYAFKQVKDKANIGDALTQRPGEVARMKAAEDLENVQNFVGNQAAAKGVTPRSPAAGAPFKPIKDGPLESINVGPNSKGKIDAQFFPEARQAEYMLQKPAANMNERWGNAAEARSALLAHERTAMINGDTVRADAMRAIADTVRDQQEKMVKAVLPKPQADALITHLKNADTRYRAAIEAGGPDIVKTIAGGGAKGNQARAKFDALAANDPAAQRMMNALTTAEKRAGDKTLFHIALTAAGTLHFIPVVGTAASAVAGAITVAKLKQMGTDYMVRRGAGQLVTFKDLVAKEFPQVTSALRQGGAAVGSSAGVDAARALVAPAAPAQPTDGRLYVGPTANSPAAQ